MKESNKELSIVAAVTIDGKALSESHQIHSIQITLNADDESLATVTINESSQATDSIHFPDNIQPHSDIEIALGYDTAATVFSGTLIALEARVASGLGTVVVLNAVNDADYSEANEVSVCFEYGESLLDFNGVTHFEGSSTEQSAFPCEVELTVQGQAHLLPGQKVALKNCSAWFDGNYQILAIRHTMENGNWLSQLVVCR